MLLVWLLLFSPGLPVKPSRSVASLWSKAAFELSKGALTVRFVRAFSPLNKQICLPLVFAVNALGKVLARGCVCKRRGGEVMHPQHKTPLLLGAPSGRPLAGHLALLQARVHPALAHGDAVLLARAGTKHLDTLRAVKLDICRGSERRRIFP